MKLFVTLIHPLIFAPLLGAYIVAWALPATWWIEPFALKIAQLTPGTVPVVAFDRAIYRGFAGAYTVDVRSLGDGNIACSGSDNHQYRPRERGLREWSLVEWAGGSEDCANLPPGVYFAEACWTVKYPFAGIIPPKTTCITSNPFRVDE